MQRLAWAALLVMLGCKPAGGPGGKEYRIEVEAPATVLPGTDASLSIKIVPLSGYKIHPESPLSISFSALPAIKFDKARLTMEDARGDKSSGPTFVSRFSASADFSGAELAADLSFFICTPKWCAKRSDRATRDISAR